MQRRAIGAEPNVSVFLVRLVAPYALGALAIVVKFFLRNPLRKGIIRTHVAAVRELVHWLVTAILSRLSFTERPATDV
jgi:hypothetical protein